MEKVLIKKFISALQTQANAAHVPFSYYKIETGATHIGVPDALFLVKNRPLWIEFKEAANTGRVQFRPMQKKTIELYNKCHMPAAAVALKNTPNGVCFGFVNLFEDTAYCVFPIEQALQRLIEKQTSCIMEFGE